MKPIKNQIFCYGCRKHKMLFESQKKADNFIRYNSEGIQEENGKSPVRSYYCEMCGGYHVTSNPSKEIGERLDQRDRLRIESLSTYKKETEEINAISDSLSQRLERIRTLIFFGEFDEAEDLFSICDLDIEELSSYQFHGGAKLRKLQNRVNKMSELLSSVKGLINLSEQEQANIISDLGYYKEQQTLRKILSNIKYIERIKLLIDENKSALENNNTEEVNKKLNECRMLLSKIQSAGKKEMTRKYNTIIQEQQLLRNKITNQKQISNANLDEADASNCNTIIPFYNKKEYKNTILSLIERIESIKSSFEAGNYDDCETSLEICYYMLEELHVEDENTDLIKGQINKWAKKLKEIN